MRSFILKCIQNKNTGFYHSIDTSGGFVAVSFVVLLCKKTNEVCLKKTYEVNTKYKTLWLCNAFFLKITFLNFLLLTICTFIGPLTDTFAV